MSSERRLGKGLKQLNRDVYNILRRVGPAPVVISEIIEVVASGASGVGPYPYDYLVDKQWAAIVAAGGGTEGQEKIAFHGQHFWVYSNVKAAIDNGKTRFSGLSYSVGVVAGEYGGDGTITWPNDNPGSDDIASLLVIGFSGLSTYISLQSSERVKLPNIIFPNVPAGVFLENLHTGSWTSTVQAVDIHGRASGCHIGSIDVGVQQHFDFDHCRITSIDLSLNQNVDLLSLQGCFIDGDLVFDGDGDITELLIGDTTVEGNIKILASASKIGIGNNILDGGTDAILIDTSNVNGNDKIQRIGITGNQFRDPPSSGTALINVKAIGNSTTRAVARLNITGNELPSFTASSVTALTCYLNLLGFSGREIRSVIFAHNTLSDFYSVPSLGTNRVLEDIGGFSVIGDYVWDSIFGPNTPVSKVQYQITNGVNNLFTP